MIMWLSDDLHQERAPRLTTQLYTVGVKTNLSTNYIQDIGGGIRRGKVKMDQVWHRGCPTSSDLEAWSKLPVVCYLSVIRHHRFAIIGICGGSADPLSQNPVLTQSVFSPEIFPPRYSKYPTTEDHRLAMDGKNSFVSICTFGVYMLQYQWIGPVHGQHSLSQLFPVKGVYKLEILQNCQVS